MKKNTQKSTMGIRSKKDPVAKELRTPKYRSRVVPNKKKNIPRRTKNRNINSIED